MPFSSKRFYALFLVFASGQANEGRKCLLNKKHVWAGAIAQSVKYLPCKHENRVGSPKLNLQNAKHWDWGCAVKVLALEM